MAIQLGDQWMRSLTELRYQPTDKRVRAMIGGQAAADSVRAVLVWEPGQAAPEYAVPAEDVLVPLVPASRRPASDSAGSASRTGRSGFRPHTCPGEELSLRIGRGWGGQRVLDGAAFRPADPSLAGYVVLDFAAFDAWLEEDEPIVGHPRDPFHRFDVRRSSRHVRVMLGDRVLAESRRPRLVFETLLPVRFYLPREDVNQHLLQPSVRRTKCPYKGEARYWSVRLGGYLAEDLAWSYPQPLPPAAELTDLLCFFDERVDVEIDGVRRERPLTVWS